MSLLSFMAYPLTTDAWSEICLPPGQLAAAWMDWDADVILASDTSDVAQQVTFSIAKGDRFMLPLPRMMQSPTPTTILQSAGPTLVCFAKTVSGSGKIVVTALGSVFGGS